MHRPLHKHKPVPSPSGMTFRPFRRERPLHFLQSPPENAALPTGAWSSLTGNMTRIRQLHACTPAQGVPCRNSLRRRTRSTLDTSVQTRRAAVCPTGVRATPSQPWHQCAHCPSRFVRLWHRPCAPRTSGRAPWSCNGSEYVRLDPFHRIGFAKIAQRLDELAHSSLHFRLSVSAVMPASDA